MGMGLGSRSGKQMMHSDVRPAINLEKCTGCSKCRKWCPGGAITLREEIRSPLSWKNTVSAAVNAQSAVPLGPSPSTGKQRLMLFRKKSPSIPWVS
nr:4Fe-4S binding protein [Desulforamulus putei]